MKRKIVSGRSPRLAAADNVKNKVRPWGCARQVKNKTVFAFDCCATSCRRTINGLKIVRSVFYLRRGGMNNDKTKDNIIVDVKKIAV